MDDIYYSTPQSVDLLNCDNEYYVVDNAIPNFLTDEMQDEISSAFDKLKISEIKPNTKQTELLRAKNVVDHKNNQLQLKRLQSLFQGKHEITDPEKTKKNFQSPTISSAAKKNCLYSSQSVDFFNDIVQKSKKVPKQTHKCQGRLLKSASTSNYEKNCGIQVKSESKATKYSSASSLNSCKSQNEENVSPKRSFKAKPATIIHQKPFKPQKKEYNLLKVTEFNFNLSHRAKKRIEFDKKIKQKEKEAELLNLRLQKMKEQQELEEINALRKKLVHKPVIMPQYKEFKIQPSFKKLTFPKSPRITKRNTK